MINYRFSVYFGLVILALSVLTMTPGDWWAAHFLTNFQLHFAALGVAVFASGLLLRRWPPAFLGVVVLLINTALVLSQFAFPAEAARVPESRTVRVMSLNVLYSNEDVNALRESVIAVDPDLLLLQEVNANWNERLGAIADLFPYRVMRTGIKSNIRHHGAVLLSRYPISEAQRPEIGGVPSRIAAALVDFQGQPVWVASAHLFKPNSPENQTVQRKQFADLSDWIMSRDAPVIVGGDFNSTRYMPEFSQLIADRHLATDQRPRSWWAPFFGTYPAWLPILSFKIDHILADDAVIVAADTVVVPGSDHRAVIADISLE